MTRPRPSPRRTQPSRPADGAAAPWVRYAAPQPEALAVTVLSSASRERPADAVLREVLRNTPRASRELSRAVAGLVFAYYRWRGWLDLGQPWLRQLQAAQQLASAYKARPDSIPVAELSMAVPAWLGEEMSLDSAWLAAIQAEPRVWLRARAGAGDALLSELPGADRPFEALPEALIYHGEKDLFREPLFQSGQFELQDIASQWVSVLAAPNPGERWWDACAGEGGKTLHLADLLQNRGLVWATDPAAWRLRQLRLRARRACLHNIRWSEWRNGQRPPGRAVFEGVLVDAPCSGVGTWQRNPHARWTTTAADVSELADLQLRILQSAVPAVKPGGRLIYAVCTLTRKETVEVAARFQEAAPDFEPLPWPEESRPSADAPPHQTWVLPQTWGGNGMFIAAWKRVR